MKKAPARSIKRPPSKAALQADGAAFLKSAVAASAEFLKPPRVVYLRFPDETVCAKILDLLRPFDRASQDLLLQIVEVNRREFPNPMVANLDRASLRSVELSGSGVASNPHWFGGDDPLAEFLEKRCELSKELSVAKGDLEIAYKTWCREKREPFPLSRDTFRERLAALGVTSKQLSLKGPLGRKQTRCWIGIGLKTSGGGK